MKTPSEDINYIWREMKLLKRLREEMVQTEQKALLEDKYTDIEILFGHESTLSKAIIYHLDHP